ncbi:MAG: STAS/SEC14 domain-containing protein [Gemmatimonadetes bacterium]|nr:STAS/SEC14 domain-containing protein [Gemmatimonadota bacterium]
MVVATMVGQVGAADVQAFHRALFNDPAFDPGQGMLIDLRLLEQASSQAEAEAIADDVRQLPEPPGARRAVVATRPAHFGVSRMLTTIAALRGSKAEFQVFRDFDEALAWASEPPVEDAG